MQKLVSVIITAFNSSAFLEETLSSAERQSYPSLEIIVVDDGSREDRSRYIEETTRRFARARLIRQANGGLSAARNRGAEASNGDYLAFLDHDDLWEPEFLETLIAKLDGDNTVDATFSRIIHMRSDGVSTGRKSKGKLSSLGVPDFLISDPLCCGSCFVIRRGAFESIHGFAADFQRAETPEFFIRFLEAGLRLEGVEQHLVRYRNTPGSLSSGRNLLRDRKRVQQQAFLRNPHLATSFTVRFGMLANQMRIQLRRLLLR